MTNNIENVVKENYWIGCDACAFFSVNSMKFEEYGEHKHGFKNRTNLNPKNLDLEIGEKPKFIF